MSLLDWFRKKDNTVETPEGVCPNCWGRQDYDDQFIKVAEDRQIDINNHNSMASRAFVQEFVTTYLDGIRLKKDGNQFVCPSCKAGYKTVNPKV